jgi:hypothetical protein
MDIGKVVVCWGCARGGVGGRAVKMNEIQSISELRILCCVKE